MGKYKSFATADFSDIDIETVVAGLGEVGKKMYDATKDKEALEATIRDTQKLYQSNWNKDTSLYVTDGLTVLLSSYDGFSTTTRFGDTEVIWANAVKSGTSKNTTNCPTFTGISSKKFSLCPTPMTKYITAHTPIASREPVMPSR